MIISVIIMVIGLAALVGGADFLVEGAGEIARRWHIPEFVIGFTVVAVGTSLPELVVSLIGTVNGAPEIAAGNVFGSNIFNSLLILGVTALISPVVMTKTNRLVDVPVNLTVTVFGCSLAILEDYGRLAGAVLLACFLAYTAFSLRGGDNGRKDEKNERKRPIWLIIAMTAGGIAALVVGGHFFVGQARTVLGAVGVPDKVIVLTVLAGGTSLPELVTCIVAAAKKKTEMAFGNIIGSNVSNVLLILGTCSVIKPISFDWMTRDDLGWMVGSALWLIMLCYFSRRKADGNKYLGRFAGLLLLVAFATYIKEIFQTL